MSRRMLALAAVIALAAACDKKPQAEDARAADQDLARDNLMSNDLTAIDAASGADANMAADLDIANMDLNEDENTGPANGQAPRPRRQSTARPATEEPAPANDSAPPETEDGAD